MPRLKFRSRSAFLVASIAVHTTTANLASSAGWNENLGNPIQRREPLSSRTIGSANGSNKISNNTETPPSIGQASRRHIWYSTREPINSAAPPMVAPMSWRNAKVDPASPD